ncbi:MAG: hypothetical protein WD269_04165 [Acidimicrobiia bacterium]
MAMLLVVTAKVGDWAAADALRRLGRLGITSLSVLEAHDEVALLVQGWAFDAEASSEMAVAILAADASDVTVFHPVVQVGVTPRAKGDGENETIDEVGIGTDDGGGDEPGGSAGMGASTPDRHQPQRGD